MSYEIRARYDQPFMMPPSLDEWVGEDHPARFVRTFVDQLDLKQLGFRGRKSEDGRPSYAADLLLKVWLYGYMSRIYSTRQLERACREHISLLWLTGRKAPDHNTLWRFWRNNRMPLRGVFRQAVAVAFDARMVGMAVHAVDGTRIRADVSKARAWHRKQLMTRLEETTAMIEKEIEIAEDREVGEYRLPDELKGPRLAEKIREALGKLDEEGKDHLHPTDLEARMMKCDDTKSFAFNAQAVADADSGLIVGQSVTNEENDMHCLTPMIQEVEGNLGKAADETLADAGYACGAELKKAAEAGYDVLINLGGNRFHSSRFRYDPEENVCMCPLGGRLRFERTKRGRRGKYMVSVYRCHGSRQCPFAQECSRDKRGKSIEIGPYRESIERQREKQEDPSNRELLRKRKAIIEPVFGVIKHAMGFRRWTLRGLEGVRTQWAMVCTAYNLAKIHRARLKRRHAVGQIALAPIKNHNLASPAGIRRLSWPRSHTATTLRPA